MSTALHDAVRDELRERVRLRGRSHQFVADRTGLNKTTVTRVLSGERKVTLEVLYRFAQLFDVKASTLVTRAEERLLRS